VARFRYRFERARFAARCASQAATRAVASACDVSRLARDALERSRAPDDATAVNAALRTGDGSWVALLDRDNWRAVCSARERACSAAHEDALRTEHRARAACEIAKRRFDGFERHRGRALEAFWAQEDRREETERDDARVRS
jgi:hypothetical protein